MTKVSRKEQILQTLAAMLEATPGARITTKSLAAEVGVSEAALYRHFPSKTRMLEGLIGFADEAVSNRINRLKEEGGDTLELLGHILTLLLLFAERNPGITRLLVGDALLGEHERLHRQVEQFFNRIESQLKQLARQTEFNEQRRTRISAALTANLLMSCVQGHLLQFVRSGFTQKPSDSWPRQWQQLQQLVFVD